LVFLNLGNCVSVLFLTISIYVLEPENTNIELFFEGYKEIIALKEKNKTALNLFELFIIRFWGI